MTYSDLQALVELNLQDASAEIVARIPSTINDVLHEISMNVPMPSLKRILSVVTTADIPYITLQGGFSGRLRRVTLADGTELKIFKSIEELISYYPTYSDSGDLEACALEGTVLWYTQVPTSATSLQIICYIDPVELVVDDDEPDWLPRGLHEQLVVNGASHRLWNYIEQGVDAEQRVNTNVTRIQYTIAIQKLHEWTSATGVNRGMSWWPIKQG